MGWLTHLDWLIVALTYGLDATFLMLAIRRHIRVWSLLALVVSHLLTYPAAMYVALRCSAEIYMHTFCWLGGLDAALQLLVIVAVFAGIRKSRTEDSIFAACAMGALALIAFGVFGASFHPETYYGKFILLSRDLALFRLLLCIGIAVYGWLWARHWASSSLRVFIGITLAVFAEAAIAESQIISHFSGYAVAKYMPTVVYWFAVGVWTTIPNQKQDSPL